MVKNIYKLPAHTINFHVEDDPVIVQCKRKLIFDKQDVEIENRTVSHN